MGVTSVFKMVMAVTRRYTTKNYHVVCSKWVNRVVRNYISVKRLLKKKKRQFEYNRNSYYCGAHLTCPLVHLSRSEPVTAEKFLWVGDALLCDHIVCDWKMTSLYTTWEVMLASVSPWLRSVWILIGEKVVLELQ